jgi:anaerobic selenocysteine-containing dehydrogenase
MATVATVCGYCGVGCGMDLHVSGGVVTQYLANKLAKGYLRTQAAAS